MVGMLPSSSFACPGWIFLQPPCTGAPGSEDWPAQSSICLQSLHLETMRVCNTNTKHSVPLVSVPRHPQFSWDRQSTRDQWLWILTPAGCLGLTSSKIWIWWTELNDHISLMFSYIRWTCSFHNLLFLVHYQHNFKNNRSGELWVRITENSMLEGTSGDHVYQSPTNSWTLDLIFQRTV